MYTLLLLTCIFYHPLVCTLWLLTCIVYHPLVYTLWLLTIGVYSVVANLYILSPSAVYSVLVVIFQCRGIQSGGLCSLHQYSIHSLSPEKRKKSPLYIAPSHFIQRSLFPGGGTARTDSGLCYNSTLLTPWDRRNPDAGFLRCPEKIAAKNRANSA